MQEKMKALIREHDMCVLATAADRMPHCSLMCYMADENCGELYMMTRRGTKKYRNLTENGEVSILIDTRVRDREASPGIVRALTVAGTFRALTREEQRRLRSKMRERFPHLAPIADAADAEVFAVGIGTMQLLDGVAQSSFAGAD